MTACRSGKVRYRDKVGAMVALARLDLAATRGMKKDRSGNRAYHCRHCRGWHLGRPRAK